MLNIELKCQNELDPGFVPASIWNREYRKAVTNSANESIKLCLEQPNGIRYTIAESIFVERAKESELNFLFVERLLKALLWQVGGSKIYFAGPAKLFAQLAKEYSAAGKRSFDNKLIGEKVYGHDLEFIHCKLDQVPDTAMSSLAIGGYNDGCRIGFDLGGSDRKCSATIDGKVVHTEEVGWHPYFQKDPEFHLDGIQDSLKRAAAKLPRVDAIGGSAAGVYVDNQVKIASLFRGVSEEDFTKKVENIFLDIQKEWNVPMVVVNDGDVTALNGAQSIGVTPCLGLAMGTSEAVGYVDKDSKVTGWLNEFAFSPVDYRENGPEDEWSSDLGCGVQYFSQQAVARLAPLAGIELPEDMTFADRLIEVQKLMQDNDERARKIYETIGIYLGYAIPHYAEFYDMANLLILGRVTSGEGGEIILAKAREVLEKEFPAQACAFHIPNEQDKRHGQAVTAAGLAPIY